MVDGSGQAARSADVLVRGDTIAHVGPVDADTIAADQTFDASGLHVTPGFIDPHAHGNPRATPRFRNFLAMGVTTILLGQDGSSPEAQAFPEHLTTVAEAKPFVNVGYLVGHNTLRQEAGIGYNTPTDVERRRLAALVEQGLEAVHTMTGRTASILGLDDPSRVETPRGLVREGYAADLLAFDPDAVRDQADFARPHRLARGMRGVWVNGTRTWASDTVVGATGAGAVLRSRTAE